MFLLMASGSSLTGAPGLIRGVSRPACGVTEYDRPMASFNLFVVVYCVGVFRRYGDVRRFSIIKNIGDFEQMTSLKHTDDRRIYAITPCAKPRMTRADVWQKRPAVVKYRAFCDACRAAELTVPESGSTVLFFIPMPESWSKKKKIMLDNTPHRQTPDVDNLLKAVLDAIYVNDCCVWNIHVIKRWAYTGAIVVY